MANVKVKVVLNKKGIKEFLQSDEVAEYLKPYAEEMQANAKASSGEEYKIRQTKTDRVGYNVYAATKKAKKDNLDNNTLLKSIPHDSK